MGRASEVCCSSRDARIKVKELESKFLSLLPAKGPLDHHVRKLSNSIRDCYKSILLADHSFDEAHEVEYLLWQLHYRQIDDFRHRINWVSGGGQGCRANSAFHRDEQKTLLQDGFKSFLEEASRFYHDLMSKLRGQCGLLLDSRNGLSTLECDKVKRCKQFCFGCFLRLGDYARYKEKIVDSGGQCSPDYSIAADFYKQAISEWPVDGHPHNQLAVLATYVENELLAVYYYYRSLAAEKPFPTTRENLTLWFDQNRVKYERLSVASQMPSSLSNSSVSRKATGLKAICTRMPAKSAKRDVAKSFEETVNYFITSFVRLNGLIFTNTSLEKFEEVLSAVCNNLDLLLELDDTNLEEAFSHGRHFGIQIGNFGAFGALQLITILICTIENVEWGLKANISRYADASLKEALFRYALIAFLEVVNRLLHRCGEAIDASNWFLLPAMLVVLEWLACKPEIMQLANAYGDQLNLLSSFWKQCAGLLNRFEYQNVIKGLQTSSLEDCKAGLCLWEDYELEGFSPLAAAHAALDFSKRSFVNTSDMEREKHVRLYRLLAAGKAIVNVLDGSGTGIVLIEGSWKFHLAGEMEVKKSACEEFYGTIDTSDMKSCNLSQNLMSNKREVSEKTLISNNREVPGKIFPMLASGDYDDDDELIVFKPVAKDQPITAGCRPDECEALNQEPMAISSISSKKENSPATSPYSSVFEASSELGLTSATVPLERVTLHAAASLFNNSKACSLPSSGPLLVDDRLRNMPSSIADTSPTRSVGVIGEPKQQQSCSLKWPSESPNKVVENMFGPASSPPSEACLVANRSGAGYPGFSLPSETSLFSHGDVTIVPMSMRLKGSYPYASAGMQPPPGFHTRPKQLLADGLEYPKLASNEMKCQQAKYQYKPSANIKQPYRHETRQNFPSGYGADFSLWSSGISQPARGADLFHPSQVDIQEQGSTQFLRSVNDKDAWSLFGASGYYRWSPTIFS